LKKKESFGIIGGFHKETSFLKKPKCDDTSQSIKLSLLEGFKTNGLSLKDKTK